MPASSRPLLHRWDLPPQQAEALQRELAARIVEGPPLGDVHLVAGVDVGIRDDLARAAVVVLTYPDLRPIEQATYEGPVTFPYIPGLLAFREAPAVLAAIDRLKHQPDVFIIDGQGRAHPRHFGIACHVGLWLERPTIGCAKSRLYPYYSPGQEPEPGPNSGDRVPLLDRGEVIGMVVRTRPGTKPLYISVGHRIDLDSAVRFVLNCVRGYRLPEPTRLAHRVAAGETVVPSAQQPTLFD